MTSEYHSEAEEELTQLLGTDNNGLILDAFLLRLLTKLKELADPRADLPLWLVEGLRKAVKPEVFRDRPEGLARACGRSSAHVGRVVKRLLGKTLSQIVNEIRLEHATLLLKATDKSIEMICYECGFENQSYFYRLFRVHHGLTPRRFRHRIFHNSVTPARSLA